MKRTYFNFINNESILSDESNAGIALGLVTTTFCVILLDTAKNAQSYQ